MKIALVCPASLPATQFGGILFLCVDIARESAKLGHDVTIYTTDLDFANNANTFNKKLPRLESQQGFKINRTHSWFSFRLFFVNPSMYFQLKKDRPDIIHTIGIRSFQSLVAAMISKKHKIPLVISDQGGLTTHPDLQSSSGRIIYRLQNPIIRFIIKQASKISVANEYERKIFSQFGAESKTIIVRNGIDLESFKIKHVNFKEKYSIHDKYILFIGRFHKVKGIDILLKSWAELKNDPIADNVTLVIMGVDFGFESDMIKIIRDLKMEQKTMVIRKPPREDVIAAYDTCEFLVLPSRWELSPLTPLEGFAFKKAVITTNSHGIPHTIKKDENSILVESENYLELADAIRDLLKNDQKRTEYGLAGYKMVQEFCTSQIMCHNTLKMYQEILNK